jgi:hypothetical protein
MTHQLSALTPEQEEDLNFYYDIQQQEWLEAIETITENLDENSSEVTALLEAEARWERERDYYHHQYYDSDRFGWS